MFCIGVQTKVRDNNAEVPAANENITPSIGWHGSQQKSNTSLS